MSGKEPMKEGGVQPSERGSGVSRSSAFISQFSTPEFWSRLALAVFAMTAFSIGAFIKPLARQMALGAILVAFAGAAFLWWESNSDQDRIAAIIDGIVHPRSNDGSFGTRILNGIAMFISWSMQGLSFLIVAVLVWAREITVGTQAAWDGIAWVWFLAVFVIAVEFGIIWSGKRYMAGIRSAIVGNPADQLNIARRAMRTWGFMLIGLASLLQIYPTWISYLPGK